MMIRKANERGVVNLGWLHSFHTFSFGHYYDPKFMGYGPLRVINDDKIKGAGGFPTHGHADMEIITYVVEGALQHQDSDGNQSVIRPGEVQKMSAGKGIRHSEFNDSKEQDVHLLQIWIEPDKRGIPSSYQQKAFSALQSAASELTLLVSPDGQGDSITIEQQAWLFGAKVAPHKSIEHQLGNEHLGWLQIVKGSIDVNGERLQSGDGAAFEVGERISMSGSEDAEILLFEMTP
ncbi:MAG: pirin family protein [Aestuariibacter sp.]